MREPLVLIVAPTRFRADYWCRANDINPKSRNTKIVVDRGEQALRGLRLDPERDRVVMIDSYHYRSRIINELNIVLARSDYPRSKVEMA
jgi:hypothetical protein